MQYRKIYGSKIFVCASKITKWIIIYQREFQWKSNYMFEKTSFLYVNGIFYEFMIGKLVKNCSIGKESTCNAGDPGSIPGLGRSSGEGIGYPFQYSWASLVTHLVENLPVWWETWVWSLDSEDTLEKGKATHSSILAWRIPWTV